MLNISIIIYYLNVNLFTCSGIGDVNKTGASLQGQCSLVQVNVNASVGPVCVLDRCLQASADGTVFVGTVKGQTGVGERKETRVQVVPGVSKKGQFNIEFINMSLRASDVALPQIKLTAFENSNNRENNSLPANTARTPFEMPSALPQHSDNKFLDYLYALGRGIEGGRDEVVDAILHPIDTARNLAVSSFDGYNAISGLLFNYSTEGSRARNAARGEAVLDGAERFWHADGTVKTETISKAFTAGILGASAGVLASEGVHFAYNAAKGCARNNFVSSSKPRVTSQPQATSSSHNATTFNAHKSINKKFSALENAQKDAVKIQELPDGRVRYYTEEIFSTNSGPTRGSSYVTEYNPNNGQIRSWMECYDHSGNVNRVHPKMLDGQDLKAQHYPPTKSELESFSQNSPKPRGPQ